MKRADLLGLLRYAGFHEDKRYWVRLYVENRVSRKVANEQWRAGQRMRATGARCTCRECSKSLDTAPAAR